MQPELCGWEDVPLPAHFSHMNHSLLLVSLLCAIGIVTLVSLALAVS